MLSSEQVRFFHDNGYLIMRQVVPAEDIQTLRRAVDRLQRTAVDRLSRPGYLEAAAHLNDDWIEHPDDHFVYRRKSDGSYGFHRIERGFSQDPLFAQMAVSRRILTPVWQVLERPFWPRAGNIVVKLPHEGAAVRWHQDIPYLYWSSGGHTSQGRPTTHPIPNFTTDVYLEPSNADNGCLYAIPGSHRGGTVDVDQLVAEQGWFLKGAVPLELEPGDVMFHHVALVHGSPENHSPEQRRTFYIHYLTDETVADAYPDWPDLKTAQENQVFWSAAMADRRAMQPDNSPDLLRFKVSAEGITAQE